MISDVAGQRFELAVELARLLELLHELHGVAVFRGALLERQRQAEGLQIIVAQDEARHIVGHLGQQRVAVGARRAVSPLPRATGAILILTSMSEELTPAELSIASVLIRPPLRANSMRALLRDAEIGALADDLDLELAGIDAQRVIGAVAGIGLAFVRGLHIGADAAEPQQIGRRQKQRMHELLRRRLVGARGRSAP